MSLIIVIYVELKSVLHRRLSSTSAVVVVEEQKHLLDVFLFPYWTYVAEEISVFTYTQSKYWIKLVLPNSFKKDATASWTLDT